MAYNKGPFNNYVDKMSGGGGQKMSVFVHAQGIKTVQARGRGGLKMAKFCPRSCWMTPKITSEIFYKLIYLSAVSRDWASSKQLTASSRLPTCLNIFPLSIKSSIRVGVWLMASSTVSKAFWKSLLWSWCCAKKYNSHKSAVAGSLESSVSKLSWVLRLS